MSERVGQFLVGLLALSLGIVVAAAFGAGRTQEKEPPRNVCM